MHHFILIIQDKTFGSQYYVKGHTVSLALNTTVQVPFGLNTIVGLESSCLTTDLPSVIDGQYVI